LIHYNRAQFGHEQIPAQVAGKHTARSPGQPVGVLFLTERPIVIILPRDSYDNND
jgi:hypothetical protein